MRSSVSMLWVGLGLTLSTAPVLAGKPGGGAEPNARYVVMELQEGAAEARVLHETLVRMATAPQWQDPSALRTAAQASRARDVDVYTVTADRLHGGALLITAPRWVRGEFDQGVAQHALFPRGHQVVVVRMPVDGSTRVDLQRVRDGKRFGARLAPTDLLLPTPQRTPPPPGADNRVDILVMGDGYQAAEEPLFDAHVQNLRDQFFSVAPYAQYAAFHRISSLFVASAQSGADHPAYNANCVAPTPTCCADPEMLADPQAGTMVNTAFDAYFCAYNIYRLMDLDPGKVFAAAAAVPDWDSIIVLANDPVYGGAGGAPAVVSTHEAAPSIAQHEWAHTFAGLADEYETPYPGFPACSDTGFPRCEPNVTNVTTRSMLKWSPWVDTATPIPTPAELAWAGAVGLFEGARYQTSGMHRPMQGCAMRTLAQPFCPVCREALVAQLYQGGFGTPPNGIDLIDPGLEDPPPGPVLLPHGAAQTFVVTGPRPTHMDWWLAWLVDGVPVPGATADAYMLVPSSPRPVTVSVSVADASPWVRTDWQTGMVSTRSWSVTYVNQPPTLTAPQALSAREGLEVAFELTALDGDGDPVQLEVTGAPAGAEVIALHFAWTPALGQAGSYSVGFVGSDGAASSPPVTTAITVAPDHAPVGEPVGTLAAREGSLLTYAWAMSDEDGDVPTATGQGLPPGATVSNVGVFSWTPTDQQAGTYTFTLTASDGLLASVVPVTVEVANVEAAKRPGPPLPDGCPGCTATAPGGLWMTAWVWLVVRRRKANAHRRR